MRKHLWLAVAMLLLGVGCPTEFGIEGTLDQAMERDLKEGICPVGTHPQKRDRKCKDEPGAPACQTDCVAN
jgi:hypothetical protein